MGNWLEDIRQSPRPRVGIFRALFLGDLLCSVPALRALRKGLPHAHVTLIGLPWAREFVEHFGRYIDDFLEFPGYPGLPEQPVDSTRTRDFLALAAQKQFDLVIQMHGNGIVTNPLAMLLGAKTVAGFHTPGHYCPDPESFICHSVVEPEIWKHLRLMDHLGFPSYGDHLEFPLRRRDFESLRQLDGAWSLIPGGYACVHPGAKAAERRWPPERFAAVADALLDRGLQVVLTGSAGEAELTRAVANHMRGRAIDLAGRTTIGTLAALLQAARVLVCNDTGVSHLAVAVGLPSVVVFLKSDLQGWAPLDRQRHRVAQEFRSVMPMTVISHLDALLQDTGDSPTGDSRERLHGGPRWRRAEQSSNQFLSRIVTSSR